MSKSKKAILNALDTLLDEVEAIKEPDEAIKLVAWCMMIVQEQGQAYIAYTKAGPDVKVLAKKGIANRISAVKENIK